MRNTNTHIGTSNGGRSVQQTVEVVRKGSTICWIGLVPGEVVETNTMAIVGKETRLQGIMRYANVYDTAMSLVAAGTIDLVSMITHRFALDQVKEALELPDNDDNVMKSVIALS